MESKRVKFSLRRIDEIGFRILVNKRLFLRSTSSWTGPEDPSSILLIWLVVIQVCTIPKRSRFRSLGYMILDDHKVESGTVKPLYIFFRVEVRVGGGKSLRSFFFLKEAIAVASCQETAGLSIENLHTVYGRMSIAIRVEAQVLKFFYSKKEVERKFIRSSDNPVGNVS